MELSVRYATGADRYLLAEAGRRLFEAAFAQDNRAEDMQAYLEQAFSPEIQASELADPAAVTFVAVIEGNFAGYARLKEGRPGVEIGGMRPVELVRIYAEREYMGHGIGSALMQFSLEECARRGWDTIWLGVWERNPRAIRFYEKWGFLVAGQQIFKLGKDLQTDLVMQRGV
jgi:diamine N-acetyltransferase